MMNQMNQVNGIALTQISPTVVQVGNVSVHASAWTMPRKVWAIIDARGKDPVFVGASLRGDLPLPKGAVLYELPDGVPVPLDENGKVLADKFDMLVRWMWQKCAGKRHLATCERVYKEYALAQKVQTQAKAQASAIGSGGSVSPPPSIATTQVALEVIRIPVYYADEVFPRGQVVIHVLAGGKVRFTIEGDLPKTLWGKIVLNEKGKEKQWWQPFSWRHGEVKTVPQSTIELYRAIVRIVKCAPPNSHNLQYGK